MARILLGIAIIYLLYTIVRRFTRFVNSTSNQQTFNRRNSKPQKPEGHITVEKPINKFTVSDDDFVDYEEIK